MPTYSLKPGYAYKMASDSESSFEWDTVVVSEDVCANVRYCGAAEIDGAPCAVFQHMDSEGQYDGTYYAQTKVFCRD